MTCCGRVVGTKGRNTWTRYGEDEVGGVGIVKEEHG